MEDIIIHQPLPVFDGHMERRDTKWIWKFSQGRYVLQWRRN